MEIQVESHIDTVIEAAKEQIEKALIAIGAEAEGYAKEDCPVDTGRLRNSITYATSTSQGSPNTMDGVAAEPDDYSIREAPEENVVCVGSNVEYAADMELLSMNHKVGKAHFLRDSLSRNPEHFKAIIEAALKS